MPQNYWDQFEEYKEPATNYWDQFEEAPKEDDSGWGSFGSGYGLPSMQDIYSTALKIPGQLIETGVGALDYLSTPWRSMAPGAPTVSKYLRENTSYDPEGWEREISENEDSPRLKAAREEQGKASGFIDTMESYWKNPGLALLEAEASAVPMYIGGALGRVAKPILGAARGAMAGEAAMTAGQQAAEITRENNDFTPADFMTVTGSSALTSAISGVGNKATKWAGLPDIDEFLADTSIPGYKRIPGLFAGGLMEAGEESAQSAQEKIATNLATGRPWNEGVSSAAVSGGVAGFGMGSVIPAFRRGATPPNGEYTQQEFDFGTPDPRQQQLPFDPVQGPQSQPSKIWPGIDPVTGRFRKIYPEATQQGQLPFEPETDETGQISLDLGVPQPFENAGGPRAKSFLEKIADEQGSIPPPSDWFGQGGNEPLPGETTGRVAGMPASAQDALTTILNNPGNDPVVDASADDFQLRVSKSTNPQELAGLLQLIEMHPRQDAITRGLADVVRQRLNTIQPEVRYQAPDPLAAIPNPEGRGNFGNDAWEETEDDMVRTGPIGLVPRSPDTFSDEQARGIVDRALPPPAPEPQPATEYGQNPLDNEALEWMREQDRIIAENQAQNGPLMGPPDDEIRFQSAENEPPRGYRIDPDELVELNNLSNRIQVTQDEDGAHLFIDGKELNVWNGGPTATEIKNVHGLLEDPESHRRFEQLRDANGTGYLIPKWKRDLVAQELDRKQGRPPSIREQLGLPPGTPSIPIADQNDFNNSQVRGESPGRMLANEATADIEGRDAAIKELMRQNYGAPRIQAPTSDEDFINQVMGSGIAYANKPRENQGQLPFAPGELEKYMEAMNPNKPTPTEDDNISYQRADSKGVAPFTPRSDDHVNYNKGRGKVQIYNLAEDLINQLNRNIPDDPRVDTIIQAAQDLIANETDPEIIADNFRQLEEYAQRAHLPEGSPDQIELLGMLRDDALDKLREEEGPARAKATGGGLVVDAHITRMAGNLTKDYTSPLPGIMGREGAQNALDAVKDMGSGGKVVVRLTHKSTISRVPDSIIEIYDNGPGMDEAALSEKLVRLFASGKENEAGASGGKGIGSASYILGGEHFSIETVAVDKTDGKKYRIEAGGTPGQFLDPVKGSDWNKTEVSNSTPTGTVIKVKLKDDQSIYYTSEMIKHIGKFSRDKDTQVIFDPNDYSNQRDISEVDEKNSTYIEKFSIPATKDDKLIGELNFNDSDIAISIPKFDEKESRDSMNIHYLNNGMYQFSEYKSFEETKGMPSDVIVNISPQMDEQEENYPFINTREDVKKDLRQYITEYIDKNITKPAINKKKNRTQELYDMMPHVSIPGTKRKTVIFDPGERLTKQETAMLINHPDIHALVRHWDGVIDDIIQSTGRTEWADRLEGIGLVMDPNMHGVHIPNPATKKSTILINPFIRMEEGLSPADNAFDNTITALHEAAHIGAESGFQTQPIPSSIDMAEPRYAKFYMSMMEQIQRHGDTNPWANTGHGMGFVQRLGEVYAKFGPARTFTAADRLEAIFTGGKKSGGYSPKLQKLLQLYTDSRGRPETTEDLLSGTGVKQSNPEHGGKSNVPSNTGLPGAGVTPRSVTETVIDETTRLIKDETGAMPIPSWKGIKGATGWGQGKSKPAPTPGPQYNAVHEFIMLPAGATTTGDLSAPGRQGLALIHTPQYWKALIQMPRGLLNSQFEKMDRDLRAKAIFQPIMQANGKPGKSLAQEAGLELMVPASSTMPGIRAQQIASKWLETGGFLGPEYIKGVKNPARAAYFHTIGYPVRASNRAFITFLNSLRANRFEYLVNRAQEMSDRGVNTGRTRMPGVMGGVDLPKFMGGGNLGFTQAISKKDAGMLDPWLNFEVAKEIADFVNTATGAGPLKTHILPFRQTEINLEKHATLLSSVFFSPGLMASRIRMLNPNTYVMASPQVRKEYMKSALATGMAWYAISHMIKMAAGGLGLEDEVEISDQITSSDFGKVRIGDTRLDVGGGFQQFIVNIARVWHGGWTTAATGEFHKFGEGYRAETQLGNAQRFFSNKLNPVVKFAYDLADADQYAPFHVYDRMAQLAVPLYIQDIYEIANETPELFPLAAPIAMFGGGTQMYGKGESVGKLVDPENEWLSGGGGGIKSLMPWNWGKEEWEVTDLPFMDPDESYFEQFESEE